MSYEVKQGNLFGRIGSGIGKGLAETLPKEIERGRLAQGLQQFEKDSGNLSPIQSMARLSSIPGITPQMIQSFGELAKHQNMRNIYQNMGRGGEQETSSSQDLTAPQQGSSTRALQEVQFGNTKGSQQGQQTQNRRGENQRPQPSGQSQIVDTNPTRPEAQVALPWTQQRRNQERDKVSQQLGSYATKEQIDQEVAANEARDLSRPEAERARDLRKQEIQTGVQDKFTKALETKFQKTGSGIYNDIIGENLVSLQRGLEKDLVEHPEKSVDDAVDEWSTKGLDLSKAKNKLRGLASNSTWATPILLNKQGYRNKLDQFRKIYENAGNSEEFWNTLQSDFKMSPQGAAVITYPLNENLKGYINKVKPSKLNDFSGHEANSRKYAVKIGRDIKENDSLLAVAKDLRMKDPYFNQTAFFEQLKDDQDNLSLNQRQRREIAEGVSDILPSWGDVLILPFLRGL